MYYVIGIAIVCELALLVISLENIYKLSFDIKSALLAIERKLDEYGDIGEQGQSWNITYTALDG